MTRNRKGARPNSTEYLAKNTEQTTHTGLIVPARLASESAQRKAQALVNQAWRDGLDVGYAMQSVNDHVYPVISRMSNITSVALAVRALSPNARTSILRTFLEGTDKREDKKLLDALHDLDRAVRECSPTIRKFAPNALNDERLRSLWLVGKALMDSIGDMLQEKNPDDGTALYGVIDTYGTDAILELGKLISGATPERGKHRDAMLDRIDIAVNDLQLQNGGSVEDNRDQYKKQLEAKNRTGAEEEELLYLSRKPSSSEINPASATIRRISRKRNAGNLPRKKGT